MWFKRWIGYPHNYELLQGDPDSPPDSASHSQRAIPSQHQPSSSRRVPRDVMENKGFVNSSPDLVRDGDDKENRVPSEKTFRKKSGVRIHITAEDLFAGDNADMKSRSLVSVVCSRFHPMRLVPALEWLPHYHLPHLKDDFVAAITVAIMHVPQGLAYGELAGVSAIQGLYVSTFPPIIYALLGTTRHVSIGTFAVVALLVRGATSEISDGLIYDKFGNQTHVLDLFTRGEVATTLSAVVGIFQIIMGFLSLGSLSVLFSEPMLSGFTTGSAMHVVAAQLRGLFDIKVARRKGPFKALFSFYDVAAHIMELNWMTTIFGISAMVFIYQGQQLNDRFKAKLFMPVPMELVAVIIVTILSYFIGLKENYGSSIMGRVPTGMPPVAPPEVSLFPLMIKDGFIIAFISYVICLSLGKTFGRRNRYNVDANQELVAMGGANVVGSFLDCFPCAASLSRSSLQEKAGGKTQLTTIMSSVFLLFVVLFAGPLFFYLPKCVLSSIIIVALKGMLLQVHDCIRYSKISLIESGVWLSTFLAVFVIDLEYGIAAGAFTTVAALLYRDSRPRIRFVSPTSCGGPFMESMGWTFMKEKNGTSPTTGSGKEVSLVRIESEVNFINRDALKEQLLAHMSDALSSSTAVSGLLVLDLSTCPFVDCSGCTTLKELVLLFTARGFHICIVGASDDVIASLMLADDPKVSFSPTLKDVAFDMSAAAPPESHRF